jgi:hypothetical protein
MNTQSVTTRFVRNSSDALSDSDLNAVVGGRDKFCYVELNGNTYAIGQIDGQTVKVKVT